MITNAVVYPMHGPRGGHNPAERARHPRVLNDVMVNRLARVSVVMRKLRGWGITVLRHNLSGADHGHMPLITIKRDPAVSIAPLLDARVTWIPGPPTVGLVVMDRVTIRWEEPR